MSTIKLQGMRFHSLHGALPVEAIIGNDFVVNISIEAETEEAEKNDDLDGTINYATVYDLVKEEMGKPSKLIENVAYRIRKRVVSHFPAIERMTVEVQKKRPPVNGDVDYSSITLNYERKSGKRLV